MMFTNKSKVSTMSRGYTGFTLAEVLITLGIIGVVAALTIPSLVASYQKQVYVTNLKKFYNIMQNALVQIESEYGCVGDIQCTGIFENGSATGWAPSITANNKAGDAIVKYLKLSKNCRTDDTTDCGFTDSYHIYTNYDKTVIWGGDKGANTEWYKFITVDGMSVLMLANGGNCTFGSIWSPDIKEEFCSEVRVDINGEKQPNTYGRDIFIFDITRNPKALFYPRGGSLNGGDYLVRWKNNSGDIISCYDGNKKAYTCAGRIIEEGWEMNY